MKLCKDCKHFRMFAEYDLNVNLVKNHTVCGIKVMEPVHGKMVELPCEEARKPFMHCGNDGYFFDPKEGGQNRGGLIGDCL